MRPRLRRTLAMRLVWLGVSSALIHAASDLPLIDAVRVGDVAQVRALLTQQADPNALDVDGGTALHWAEDRKSVV